MDPHYIPLLLIAIATVAFVIWGIVYTWMTGKPFIVFNPGVPNGIVENASSVATALERREEMIRFIETPSQENYLSLHNIIATSLHQMLMRHTQTNLTLPLRFANTID